MLEQNEPFQRDVNFVLNLFDRLEKEPLTAPTPKVVKPFAPVSVKPDPEDERSS